MDTKAVFDKNNSLYQRLKPLIYKEFEWSECRVSNSGPRGPKPRALPAAPHPDKLIFTLFVTVTINCFESRATSYRSETLSLCSLGALRIALCFFLLCHCLLPPPAAAMPEPPYPDKLIFTLFVTVTVNCAVAFAVVFYDIFIIKSTFLNQFAAESFNFGFGKSDFSEILRNIAEFFVDECQNLLHIFAVRIKSFI